MTFDLRKFQEEIGEWQEKNFGKQKPETVFLGIAEEVGELSHAILKGKQGIRYSPTQVEEMKKDAIGDLVIYLSNYCNLEGFDLADCIETAWSQVKKRDWKNNPMEAHKNGSL